MTQPDPSAQSGVDPSTQSGAGEEGGEGLAGDGTAGDGTQSGAGDQQPTGRVYTEADVEAIRQRMRAADQRAAQREAELNQLKNKDLPEAERMKAELATAQEALQKSTEKLQSTMISNAFLRDNTHEWHDAETAMSLLDMSRVDIDLETGEVTGLKNAIDALAKSKPYLVKPKADEGAGASVAKGPNGTVPANNGSSGTGNPSKEKLAGRFSALRSR